MFLFYTIKKSMNHRIGVLLPGVADKRSCIPPTAFADDTNKTLKFQTQNDVDFWFEILDDAAKMTGLVVNRSKTKILLTGEGEGRTLPLPFVSQVGEVVDVVEHLGVFISLDLTTGRDKTYLMLRDKITEAITSFQKCCHTPDIFHRKMLLQSLISSKMLNVFRVYPPTDDFVGETWKQIRKVLWNYTWEGKIHGRPKVAENRIKAPISRGGLGFITPQMAADTAYLGALKANFRHACLDQLPP